MADKVGKVLWEWVVEVPESKKSRGVESLRVSG